MTLYIKDNIVALATPPGYGALAVVRISGGDLEPLFKKLASIKKPKPRHAYLSKIKSSKGKVIDSVLITLFKAPKSFTGEDVIEISCHGGTVVSALLIEELVLLGCRPALAGEFSKRAYLNGKIDLTQAESIDLIIKSSHPSDAKRGIMALEGATKAAINEIKDSLYFLLTTIEHELDFVEDEIDYMKSKEINIALEGVVKKLEKLVSKKHGIKKINKGVRACIVGPPNAGKSTLFNTILGYEKVVVSPEKGTTRDIVEAQIDIKNTPFVLIDTAGYWEGKNSLDRLGIKKTKEEIKNSDIVIVLDEKDPVNFSKLLDIPKSKPCVYAISKSELLNKDRNSKNEILLSSFKKTGVNKLLTHLSTLVLDGFLPENPYIISNRQAVLVERALISIKGGYKNLKNMDMVQLSSLLRLVLEDMDEIIGKTNNDKILNNIFNDFCVGK